MSTRLVGAVILGHGDDDGLVLPPRLAPTQIVIIPIGRGEDGQRCVEEAHAVAADLRARGVRVAVDDRDHGPGFRMNDAILKGIPLRAELGPRELEAGQVLLARRVGEVDDDGRSMKEEVPITQLAARIPDELDDYHDALLARAERFRQEHTAVVDDWASFTSQVAVGFADALHCGRPECEDEIKAETRATPRAILVEGEDANGRCVRCDADSDYGKRVGFARAY